MIINLLVVQSPFHFEMPFFHCLVTVKVTVEVTVKVIVEVTAEVTVNVTVEAILGISLFWQIYYFYYFFPSLLNFETLLPLPGTVGTCGTHFFRP